MMLFERAVMGGALSASLFVGALYMNGSVIAPCDSPIYCYGEILKQVELARPFMDSKTFVDMPAIRPLDDIQAAFDALEKPLSNNTALQTFLAENFAPPGGELRRVPADQLTANATFLNDIGDKVIREFTEKVMDIWPDLTRSYDPDAPTCRRCPNSFMPINASRPFVVAGGRFREPYYWDSYWTILGLLRTGGSFVGIARNQIENFLDFVDEMGFVPNGARIYYLNRSQPPLLALMVKEYVEHTNDSAILERALPLLIKEHGFWMANRTVVVEVGGVTHTLNRYAVLNTQPRPESYRQDYNTANNQTYLAASSGIIYPEPQPPLSGAEQASLYADLATGAETGWDYTARWLARPAEAARDVYFSLRSLNTRAVVPVELNSILYGSETAIAGFLRASGNETAAGAWEQLASKRSEAMFAVFWNETLFRYFDYNLTAGAQATLIPLDDDAPSPSPSPPDPSPAPAPAPPPPPSPPPPTAAEQISLAREHPQRSDDAQVFFNIAQFFPFWTGAAPPHIWTNPLAVKTAFLPIARQLASKAGGIAATNYRTAQQWDRPNVWPPLMHVLMAALRAVPPTFGQEDPAYIWTQDLALQLAQRYMDSTFCTWWATGGATSETPALPGFQDGNGTGVMFEKYVDWAVDAAGGGGEYEVVEGFGWTNGVVIWAGAVFGANLRRPQCPDLQTGAQQRRRWLDARRARLRDEWAL